MKRFWLGVLAVLLLPAGALAQAAPVAWTQFIDPTEHAFAFDVPQGWTVKGGVNRFSALSVHPWITAVSPDGATQIFVGDPSVPPFKIPQPGQAEGTLLQPTGPAFPPPVALRYRPGAEFAAFYGPKSLAAAHCANAVATGTQPMPDLARAQHARAIAMTRGISVTGGYTPPEHDAGIATFTCQSGGNPLAAGVIADTVRPLAGPNVWGVSVVAGYLTTPDRDAWARGLLEHILASQQWNPQWQQAMREQARKVFARQARQSARAIAAMQAQSQQFSAMLRAQGNANQAALTASHNAFMAQMNAQSAQRNAQFRGYEAQRSLNSWKFDAYIRNGRVYRDPRTGEHYEVDH